MNAQGQRVDVLAVMDGDRRTSITNDSYLASDYNKSLSARAAVAELISAADRLQRKAIQKSRLTSSVFTSEVESLRDALARVYGGAK